MRSAPRRERPALLGEARALVSVARALPALIAARREPTLRGRPVMVLPGYGTGDGATALLRRYLRARGLAVEGWGLGRNRAGLDLAHTLADISTGWDLADKTPYRREAGVALLADRVAARVVRRAAALGQPLALVGWSLGGTIAREVARDLPDAVDRVVTLGAPVVGGPKYTAAGPLLRARGLDLDWIERHVERRDRRPISQPVTAIVSRRDAIVPYEIAMDRVSPRVRHVEVDAAHAGLVFDPAVWRTVLEALTVAVDAPAGRSRPHRSHSSRSP